MRLSDEDGNATSLSYVDSLDTYLADATSLLIEENKQYFLEISVADKTYTASCRIPKKVGELEEQIRLEANEFGFTEAEISLRFDDIQGGRNFYMLGGNFTATLLFEEEEPQTIDGQLFFGSDQFVTDAVEDGGSLSGESIGGIAFGSDVEVLNRSITLQVAHI